MYQFCREDYEHRMEWYRDARFGMFIHWGVYALTGLQEQALARFDMDNAEYEALMHEFNPVDYDPEKWVLLA